jgi:NADH dehydrogenase [ubiquinone] 1 alpha subcomplex assembly factor 7
VADYMATCLLHPEHGYYATRDPLGAAGDFTTAPEISQMFGELLGLCLAEAWMARARRDPFTLAELGPGRGTLMADILRATQRVPGFHAAHLHLVETSPALARAAGRTAGGRDDITWHDIAPTLPDAPLFLVANEFFDALPIRQFQRAGEAGASGWWG